MGRFDLSNKEVIECYRKMLLIRRFEEASGVAYGSGLIGGFCHLYIGQEAIAVAFHSLLKKSDALITSYRDHGIALVCGLSPRSVMSELMGKITGCSKGKGGSMHMFAPEKNFYGGHGIVGAHVPLGTGMALANKYNGSDGIVFTFYGDGAANQGQVFEAMNMAAIWKLKVVYVLENNRYAMGTSVDRASAGPDSLHKRGEPFGIPGTKVDGMDMFAILEEGSAAIDYCNSNHSPVLLELDTYRYRGHSMSDPAKYRTRQELDDVRKSRDPIVKLGEHMKSHNISTEQDLKHIDQEIREIISDAVEFAKNSDEPAIDEEFWKDVYIK